MTREVGRKPGKSGVPEVKEEGGSRGGMELLCVATSGSSMRGKNCW